MTDRLFIGPGKPACSGYPCLAVLGQLTIEAGGSVTSTFGSIASTGSTSATQGGSRWDIPQLSVARTLAVSNGGQVEVWTAS